MKTFLLLLVACAIALPTAAQAKHKHIRIYKPSQPVYAEGAVPLAAVPPLAVAFDLARRTSCDPRVAVSTGPGDPGFDPAGPKTGNFLIPAIWSRCALKPQPR